MSLVERISGLLSARPVRRSVDLCVDTTGGDGQLSIPTPELTAEDAVRDLWQKRGQALARQEDWEALSQLVQNSDAARHLTPGGMSVAELVSHGARSDVVGTVEHAFTNGRPAPDAPILGGIEALETVLCEHPDDYAIALVVAQTHMDMAWIWRGTFADDAVPPLNREAFSAHMDRAQDILAPFADAAGSAPSLQAAICALESCHDTPAAKLADSYTALIELVPLDFRHMRALGPRLLPRHGGSYDLLEVSARRIAARTQHIWGKGGYTWVMLDAALADEEVLAGLDTEHFADGLHDILALRPDQFTVNLLAAYTALSLAGERSDYAAQFTRTRLHRCCDWIIRDYLTELHPLIWAHAAAGFDPRLRIRALDRFAARGKAEAHRALGGLFRAELARGLNVRFTENGPVIQRD